MAFDLEFEHGRVGLVPLEGGAGWTLEGTDPATTLRPDAGDPFRFTLHAQGRSRCVYAAAAPDGVWVWMDGRVRLVRERRAGMKRGGKDPQEGAVTPPMPGVVVRVCCAPGERVEKGQELLVISAMKMESVLKSPRAGCIAELRAQVGQQVKPGDVLVEFAPDAEAVTPEGDKHE